MKREIKFKRYYQHEDTGVISFIEWGCIDRKNKPVTDFTGFISPGCFERRYPIADCQYIGIKDTNGIEIYNGDILKDEWNHIGVVKWNELDGISSFQIEWDDGDGCMIFNDAAHCDPEVIGNIYENPELVPNNSHNEMKLRQKGKIQELMQLDEELDTKKLNENIKRATKLGRIAQQIKKNIKNI